LGWRVRDRKKEFIRGLVFDRQREREREKGGGGVSLECESDETRRWWTRKRGRRDGRGTRCVNLVTRHATVHATRFTRHSSNPSHPLPSLPMRPSIKAKETYYRGKSDLLEPHDATQPTASHCGT
jgi:hypothetical protein